MIKEVFFLRSIACLSIVFLHSIYIGLEAIKEEIGEFTYLFLDSLNIFLYFGTPLFIFLSEFLIAYSYRDRSIPKNFLRKRFAFIFLPFLCMAFFYSIPYASSFQDWGVKFFLNAFIGDFHGYFVLIIFQFYLLHVLFHHRLKAANPKVILSISFLVNVMYLAIFNLTQPINYPYMEYIWERFYWIPLFGWIFYFCLGYYCGRYYENLKTALKKYNVLFMMAPIMTSVLLLFLYHHEFITVHSSKRLDLIPHTVAIGFLMLYVTNHIKQIPHFLITISQFSFGIYLLHYFYILLFDHIYTFYPGTLGVSYVFLLFFGSILSSIFTVLSLNKWKYGKYIVGKIGVGYKSKSTSFYPMPQQKPLQNN